MSITLIGSINLLCTNRGIISPMRVCVRVGGVA